METTTKTTTTAQGQSFLRKLLPSHYALSKVDGGIRCVSKKGINEDDEFWDLFLKSLRQKFGKQFQEMYCNTCYNHKDFIIYLKQN